MKNKSKYYTQFGLESHRKACKAWRIKNPNYEKSQKRKEYKKNWKARRKQVIKNK